MKKYKNNFTLIELLLVLAIMGILMGAGISGLSKLNKSQAVNGAVRSIAGQISLGRSYAVSRNRYVALILPKEKVDENGNGNDNNNSNFPPDSSFIMQETRICYVKKDTSNGHYDFDGWIDGMQWRKLPQGALALISTKNKPLDESPDPPQSAPPANLKLVRNINDGTTIVNGISPAIIFNSSGAIVGGEKFITIFFGIYPYKIATNRPSSASTTPADAARKERYELNEGQDAGQNKGSRWWLLTINQFTGRTSFDRFKTY